MKSIYIEKIICPLCKTELVLDDIDYNFKGNQNEYYFCPNCQVGAYVKIRYGKHISTDWDFSLDSKPE